MMIFSKPSFLLLLTLTLFLALSLIPPSNNHHLLLLLSLLWCTTFSLLSYLSSRPRPLLLLDYSCFRPDHDRRISFEVCEYLGLLSGRFNDTSAEFMRAIYRKSGIGDEVYAPPYAFQTDYDTKFKFAIEESEEGMFAAVEAVLAKTGVGAKEITHVITACSMFSPAPSLASMVVNRFGMEESVAAYNLSGMGCSAGTMAVDMAEQLLKGRDVGYALVVVTENMSLNW